MFATDNSIYQVTPQAIVFPRNSTDVVRIAKLSSEPRFTSVVLAPRGGGTGTNGQSLTDGILVDLSRHMDLGKAFRPGRAVERVNVDFPVDLLREIDQEARRLGVTRQAFIKVRLADSLVKSH